MDAQFSGDMEFFGECEDARVESFEMFSDDMADAEDADADDSALYNESMDGDHESALASCGWGTDEDYGYFGGDDY